MFFSHSRVHVFRFFRLFFFQHFIITATTSAISKFLPKWAHVAQHKLNEYSTSRNNLSTSPTLIQYFVEQQMLNRVSLALDLHGPDLCPTLFKI